MSNWYVPRISANCRVFSIQWVLPCKPFLLLIFSQVKVTFLAIAQTYKNGKSEYAVLITPSSTEVDTETSVTHYENDHRLALIITSIDAKFFAGVPIGETKATLQGFVLIKTESIEMDSSFYVDLNMMPLLSPAPSVLPSTSPTSFPSMFLNGLPKNVEVLGE